MGRKSARQRKHLHLCLAVLIFSACTIVTQTRRPQDREESFFAAAQRSIALGDFEDVTEKAETILSTSDGNPPGDEALFTLGTVYLHPENPRRDSAMANRLFTRVLIEYPQGVWATQARIWVELLEANGTLEEVNKKLNETNTALDQSIKKTREEHEQSLQALKKLREENETLHQLIKKMKQVDIEIEEKKREKLR